MDSTAPQENFSMLPDPPTFVDGRAARLDIRPSSTPAQFIFPMRRQHRLPNQRQTSHIEEEAERTIQRIHRVRTRAMTLNTDEVLSEVIEGITEGMDALRHLISEEISDLVKELSMDEGDAVEEAIRQGTRTLETLNANRDIIETQHIKRELEMISPSPKSVSPHPRGG
ncbi:hypothetical protein NEOLEDRAFT_1182420 [Neolentinus lepideus HHB14362 ss-1]|uniref:Uncharacterized protein n=1 Tax=Neolentinus lepideus HHB14362 ss-1 TaxID=1314782 RepID=A0A165P5X8_9AGAM|nr:hypothetical protein NEOLEDRAFT_1182420 [Neolentinus lepideus HHB14362 ss-1]